MAEARIRERLYSTVDVRNIGGLAQGFKVVNGEIFYYDERLKDHPPLIYDLNQLAEKYFRGESERE